MTDMKDFEFYVLKHYATKGVFVRRGIITQLIEDLKKVENKENYTSITQELGLNDDEVISAFQITIVSHIMMFIEDLATISKSISEGKVEYYNYLDKKDEDLGDIIKLFYDEIVKAPDETFRKLLSYSDLKNFEFADDSQKDIIENIITRIIENVRKFFNRIVFFIDNHHAVFRRYKHAGLPILFGQKFPELVKEYPSCDFLAVGIVSKDNITDKLIPIPYSKKAIKSYEVITSEIFSFLGLISTFKTLCIERNVSEIIPSVTHTFGVKLTENEIQTLKQVWENFETKHPVSHRSVTNRIDSKSRILRWYTEIDKNLGRTISR